MHLLAAFLFLAACGENASDKGDPVNIYLNGTIYTGVESAPTVEAVVVEGNRIVFTGSEDEAKGIAGNGATLVDLGGAYMYPGFTDAHEHILGTGQRELILNLEGAASIAEVQQRLAAYAETLPEGEKIVGRGWIETHWPEGRFLTKEDIDAVVPDRPVYLGRSDGHAATLNSMAMDLMGITRDTVAPDGGQILHDEDGEPNGVLVDAAREESEKVFFAALAERRAEAYQVASEFLTSHGWTQVHNMGDSYDDAALMETLSDNGKIRVRIYNSMQAYFPGIGSNQEALTLIAAGPRENANGRVITRAVKLYMDGALGSRGALLFEPYHDAAGNGLLLADHDIYLGIMKDALKNGIQVNTHAIGDKGNALLLDWIEEAYAAVPPEQRAIAEPRWRDEHTQHVRPEDVPRFKALGVIPSMQPSHAIGDLYFAPARLGQERLAGSYAWNLFLSDGQIIAGGTDAPVERGDPRIEFYAAVARKSLDGFSGEGWHPELAVTRQEALKMFTAWPAYASFREDDLGTIEVGKLADFTVFSGDIMTIPEAEILNVETVMTVVDGEIVYRRD